MTAKAAEPMVLDDVASERLARLYADHHPAVRSAVCGSVEPGAVDDLVAAAFVEAGSRLASDPSLPLGPGWLVMVARRRAVDLRRRNARFRDRLPLLGPVDDGGRHAIDDAVVSQRDVAMALCSLSPRRRRAIELRYWDGRTVAEVGRILGTTTRAAESILARARADLACQLGRAD